VGTDEHFSYDSRTARAVQCQSAAIVSRRR
jgi:hypothetical protein